MLAIITTITTNSRQAAKPLSDRGKEVKGKNRRGLSPCARIRGRNAAVHPDAGYTWLCVQHEEDGANACTCGDESI